MGIEQKILVTGASLRARVASALCACTLLVACGQKGNLYLPNDTEFKQRATLPEIVRRQLPSNTTVSPAISPASSAATANTAASSPAAAASAATGR
jgi:predicted small lipoprotein YifL